MELNQKFLFACFQNVAPFSSFNEEFCQEEFAEIQSERSFLRRRHTKKSLENYKTIFQVTGFLTLCSLVYFSKDLYLPYFDELNKKVFNNLLISPLDLPVEVFYGKSSVPDSSPVAMRKQTVKLPAGHPSPVSRISVASYTGKFEEQEATYRQYDEYTLGIPKKLSDRFTFIGIYAGKNGGYASRKCKEEFHVDVFVHPDLHSNPHTALAQASMNMHTELVANPGDGSTSDIGSLLIDQQHIFASSLGVGKAFVFKKSGEIIGLLNSEIPQIRLEPEPEHQAGAKKASGKSQHFTYKFQGDEDFLIAGSTGLFRDFDPNMIKTIVAQYRKLYPDNLDGLAEYLVRTTAHQGNTSCRGKTGQENQTAIVAFF
eukprot:GHVP01025818.1.p1 GENE.GHVP01025818.1~~GHVP01025818.1.p1  ORF type:complete len:371 (+),score=61.80 GHVP01025818.1:1082-2194(+)